MRQKIFCVFYLEIFISFQIGFVTSNNNLQFEQVGFEKLQDQIPQEQSHVFVFLQAPPLSRQVPINFGVEFSGSTSSWRSLPPLIYLVSSRALYFPCGDLYTAQSGACASVHRSVKSGNVRNTQAKRMARRPRIK